MHGKSVTRRRRNSWWCSILVCCGMFFFFPVSLRTETRPLYCVIANPDLGTPEVVRTAFKPFFDFLTQRVNRKIVIVMREDIGQVIDELKAGTIDIGYTGVVDFLKMEAAFPIKPGITFLKWGQSSYTGCFTVLKPNQSSTLADFKGKRLGFISFHKIFGGFFPEILLSEKGYPGPLEKFFSQVTSYYSEMTAIQDLLAKKIDVCVVSESSIEVLRETSPFLTGNLHILYRQEGLMFAPIFYREDMDPGLREELIKASFDFFNSPGGKQFMMMFKVDGISRVYDKDYDADRTRAVTLGYIPAVSKK